MARFLRIERLIGSEALGRLQEAMVTVVGLGAVGGYAVEGLARAGIGHLRLVDFDRIRIHNINRQIIALEETIGLKKTDVLAARVTAINPNCRVETLDLFADTQTAPEILSPSPHLLIDAIDSLNPKFELLMAAHERQVPVISSMGAALRTDPSRIKVAGIMETNNCPLARRLRKKLRQHGTDYNISCVYSDEPVNFTYQDPESEADDETVAGYERGRERRVLGSLPTITGIFGLVVANLAIRRIAKLSR